MRPSLSVTTVSAGLPSPSSLTMPSSPRERNLRVAPNTAAARPWASNTGIVSTTMGSPLMRLASTVVTVGRRNAIVRLKYSRSATSMPGCCTPSSVISAAMRPSPSTTKLLLNIAVNTGRLLR
jgi:hypothetical protein